jgi:hypothetical protein
MSDAGEGGPDEVVRAVGKRCGITVEPKYEIFDDGAVGAALLHEHNL